MTDHQLHDRPERRRRARRRRHLVAQRPFIVNSTISDNYAEGVGGGMLRGGDRRARQVHGHRQRRARSRRTSARASGSTPSARSSARRRWTARRPASSRRSRNCQVAAGKSYGFNFVSDASCGLERTGRRRRRADAWRRWVDNGGLARLATPAVAARCSTASRRRVCLFQPFGDVLEGEQHLDGLVADLLALAATDQRGVAATPGTGLRRRCRGGGEMSTTDRRLLRGLTVAAVCCAAAERSASEHRPAPMRAARPRRRARTRRGRGPIDCGRTCVCCAQERRPTRASRSSSWSSRPRSYEDWQTCLRYVPVNEQGDRDRQSGFLYDERDGTGARLHGRARRRPAAPLGPRGLSVYPLQPCGRLPERQRRSREGLPSRASPCRPPRNPARAASPSAPVSGPARGELHASSAKWPGVREIPSDWRPSPSASTSGSRACRGCPSPRWAIQTGSSATSSVPRALRAGPPPGAAHRP